MIRIWVATDHERLIQQSPWRLQRSRAELMFRPPFAIQQNAVENRLLAPVFHVSFFYSQVFTFGGPMLLALPPVTITAYMMLSP